MSTAHATDSRLLSQRAVTLWMRGPKPSATDELELALVHDHKGAEDVIAARILETQDQVLFYVGTVLTRRGQSDLFDEIYDAVTGGLGAPGAARAFLDEHTAAFHRGKL